MFQTNRAKNIPSTHSRAGFTLVELLVTISIIAILASIILPAVNNARRAARVAAVRAEMKEIEQALEQFKASYGLYPPSFIFLYEDHNGWTANNPNAKRSRYLITKIWPNFDFSKDRDINGDGDKTDTHEMSAAECLVFFLGGTTYLETATGTYVAAGFSNDPEDPFRPFSETKDRKASFFRFNTDRLVDANSNQLPGYLDNYPEQENPILYFSSYDGSGYDPAECGTSGMIDVYRQTWTFANSGNVPTSPLASTALPTGIRSWNHETFQLISPGPDKQYGVGGYYASGMPQPSGAGTDIWGDFIGKRNADIDNITNFHNGELR